MASTGKKRQLEFEARYWQLIAAGIGTVEACRRVGITRKTGYRWRAEADGVAPFRLAEAVRSNLRVPRRGGGVAFLDDGVNDALALHAADVGISVESATDVASDVVDVILPGASSGGIESVPLSAHNVWLASATRRPKVAHSRR